MTNIIVLQNKLTQPLTLNLLFTFDEGKVRSYQGLQTADESSGFRLVTWGCGEQGGVV